MARASTGYGILGLAVILVVVLIVAPMVKRYTEGYMDYRCKTTTCSEGCFCQVQYQDGAGANSSGQESCVPISGSSTTQCVATTHKPY